MSSGTALHLAQAVLALHMLIALFVIFGMLAIPLGMLRHWAFIYNFGWRIAHISVAAVIALQKLIGQTCFLSVWEFNLLDRAAQGHQQLPLIHTWAIDVMHWNLPLWFFTGLYVIILIYIGWLWYIAPPQRQSRVRRGGAAVRAT